MGYPFTSQATLNTPPHTVNVNQLLKARLLFTDIIGHLLHQDSL